MNPSHTSSLQPDCTPEDMPLFDPKRPSYCPLCEKVRLPLSINDREQGNCLYACGTRRISGKWTKGDDCQPTTGAVEGILNLLMGYMAGRPIERKPH